MPNTPVNNFKDLEAENAKVKAQLEAQSDVINPDFDTDTGGSLDKLLEEQRKKAEEEADDTPPVEPNDDTTPPADDDTTPPADDDTTPPADDDTTPPADDDTPTPPTDEDPFKDAPSLPEGASKKSHEAFAHVKATAAQKYKEYEEKLAELQAKVAEAEEKLKDPVPDETKNELNELRQFRAKLDIEADPEFKKVGKDIARTEEFIYAQLLKAPNIDQSVIDDIKKLGGPTKVKMDKILATVDDPTITRLVEGKLADIELLKFNQEQAVRSAKENISAYVEKRQKEFEQAATAHKSETEKQYKDYMSRYDWAKLQQPKAGATPEQRKAAEEHNKFIQEVNGELEVALSDDSPKMRATLMTGMANLFWLQRLHKAVSARNETLEKENKELRTKLERFKKASVGRLKDSAAPAPGQTPLPKRNDDEMFTLKPGESLDRLREQMIHERGRAQV